MGTRTAIRRALETLMKTTVIAAQAAFAGLLLAASLASSPAHAQPTVAVRVDTPEFGIRIGQPWPHYGAPVVVAPAPVYGPAAVVYPTPVVVAPRPIIYGPLRVFYPAPRYYGGPYGVGYVRYGHRVAGPAHGPHGHGHR